MGGNRVMIHLVASVIEQAERFLPFLVVQAGVQRSAWEEIARLWAPMWSGSGVRFDPVSPVADTRWVWD